MRYLFKVFIFSLFLFGCFGVASFSQTSDVVSEDSIVSNSNFVSEDSILLQSSQDNSQSQSNPLSSVFLVFRMILVLAVVVACIYGVMWFFKRSLKIEASDDQFLRLVSNLTVAPGKYVQVVTLIEHAYLIGVSDDSINLIAEINDKELIQAMNLYADSQKNTKKPKSFADILDIFMPNGPRNEGSLFSNESQKVSDLINKQRDRLKDGE